MNTHESYVSLETAKMLKEAGFDWYNDDHKLKMDLDGRCYPYITLSVAARWLREVKGFLLSVNHDDNDYQYMWYYDISRIVYKEGYRWIAWIGDQWLEADKKVCDNEPQSYEEAFEKGIQKCLTLLLEENQ